MFTSLLVTLLNKPEIQLSVFDSSVAHKSLFNRLRVELVHDKRRSSDFTIHRNRKHPL